ncbi:MAG: sulfatase [Sedimentisphaeraceae bacterium JB056]
MGIATRRDFVKMAGLSSLSPAVLAGTQAKQQSDAKSSSKNVVLIILEDMPLILGCYGHPVVKTPNIDRLAGKGVLFSRAYCQYPVCNPSRSSFLSGLRPETTDVLDNLESLFEKVPDVVTLPMLLKDNGYLTVSAGKVEHGRPGQIPENVWDVSVTARDNPAAKEGIGGNLTGGKLSWCRWLASDGEDKEHADSRLTAKTINFLQKNRSEPFFLGFGPRKPHDPFVAPKKYFDMYPIEQISPPFIPENRTPETEIMYGKDFMAWKNTFDEFSEKDRKRFIQAYYAGTSFVDSLVGKIMDHLDEANLWDDTLVMLVGDHGYNLGEHNWWCKNVLFEESLITPLIVVDPDHNKPGAVCDEIVELIDIFPTITELCGVEYNHGIEGESFAHLLSDPGGKGKEAAFSVVERLEGLGRSVRTKRWRYTEWYEGKAGRELYDCSADAGMYNNIAYKEEFQPICAKLSSMLRDSLKKS